MGIKKNNKIKIFCKQKRPLVCLTAYNKHMATIVDPFCDLVLVGDSLAMVLYGETSTNNISLQTMIEHGKSVVRGCSKSIVIVDMPKGTYEALPKVALKNAKKILKETGCDGVKLEGGVKISDTIKLLVKNKIPVMGHVGLMPQQVKHPKDYKVKGRSLEEQKLVINDLKAVEKAGAFSVVIEAVTEKLANKLTKLSKIKTIGIGASKKCDGQILVTEDLLGFFSKNAKFVKKYADINGFISKAIKKFKSDVITRKFPSKKNVY
jgi:3-methyl-2-oxobutanoate hydroxymethyltransferase